MPDKSAGIPEARWMRAMTFERLVRHQDFAGRIIARAAGAVGLDRPTEVVTVNAHADESATATLAAAAHARAVRARAATLIHGLALPFPGFDYTQTTAVKPDFAAVVAKNADDGEGSWLLMGDAKDYERVRSRIDDARLLKGFLQVAVGAEAALVWPRLPEGMDVHTHGVLAVPRNAFLQPDPVVEHLHDYREEVRQRIAQRQEDARAADWDELEPNRSVSSHAAAFDPASCPSCSLFNYCRSELRRGSSPRELVLEIGIGRDLRMRAQELLDGGEADLPASVAANLHATKDGIARRTGQRRVDAAGEPGTINVVIAKSDSAALGVHGIGLQRVTADGAQSWGITVFDDPQSSDTRRRVMKILGAALNQAIKERRGAGDPVHLVVPDPATADVLVSIADNLAGVELSRLRWRRDTEQGRPALTFDGEPAVIPRALPEAHRTAVSFLLEADRARALRLRAPIIDLRATLHRHVVAGGPAASALRLDYLVRWAESDATAFLDHRLVSDEIEDSPHTPGARLTKETSDRLHRGAFEARTAASGRDANAYEQSVREELEYKQRIMEAAIAALSEQPPSTLRLAHRAIEREAQEIWGRRLRLHASDLVRFGRTYRHWRNELVPVIEHDGRCHTQLLALTNPQAARDLASDAGTRQVAHAHVVSVGPLVIEVEPRRFGTVARAVLLAVNDVASVEGDGVSLGETGGGFKVDGLSIGPLSRAGLDADADPRHFQWWPQRVPVVAVGDRLVVADFAWFSKLAGNRYITIDKPKPDTRSAPKVDCGPHSYDDDPDAHRWCCRSHDSNEAEWSDDLARRRASGQLNPDVWPPVRDGDAFEVTTPDQPVGDPGETPPAAPPDGVTWDDVE